MSASGKAAGRDGVDRASMLLERISMVAEAVTAANRVEEAIEAIVLSAREALDADRAATWMFGGGRLQVVATTGLQPHTVDRFERLDVADDDQSAGARVLMSQQPIEWVSTAEAVAHFPSVQVEQFGSGVAFPIALRDDVIGVLFVGWQVEDRGINNDERAFLRALSKWCSIAIDRDDVRRERDELVVDSDNDEIVHQSDVLGVIQRTAPDGSFALVLRGELDLSNVEALENAVHDLFNAHASEIVLYLEDLTYLDASAIRALVDAATEARTRGVTLEVRDPSPLVRRLLHIAHARWILAE